MATPKISFTVKDQTSPPTASPVGVAAVMGITERGESVRLVKNWQEYARYFGGLVSYSDFPSYCKMMLDAGAPLLIGRLLHYTDISDKNSAVGGKSVINLIWGSAPVTGALLLQAKSVGSWGNGLNVTIKTSTVSAGRLNITISLDGYASLTQTISIPEAPTQQDVDTFNNQSKLVEITLFAGVIQSNATTYFVGGYEDYTGLTDTDYTGNASAGTGLYQFDENYEQVRYAIPENSSSTINSILLNYAASRNTRCYFREPLSIDSQTAVDFRKAEGVFTGGATQDSFWATMIFGTAKRTDPVTGNTRYFSKLADALIMLARRDKTLKGWLNPCELDFNYNSDFTELYYNLAPQSKSEQSDTLHANRLSPFISKKGQMTWQGYWTLQVNDSDLKFGEVADLVAYVIRTLDGKLDPKLYKPNYIPTWKSIHDIVVAVMDNIKNGEGVSEYMIQDDSQASKISEVSYNTTENIDAGAYDFGISFKSIKSLRYINIGVNLNNSNVTYTVTQL